MSRESLSAYSPRQRLLDGGAIGLFALLAAFSLWRLIEATGSIFPVVVLVALPCGWLAADLLSGLLHFTFDTVGSVETPVIGNAFIRPFREHHVDPLAMTRHDFVETNGASCLACLPVLAATSLAPLESIAWILTQAILLFVALGAFATNQCHKWAHTEAAATPMLARWAQRWGLILPREHHQLHHTTPFDSHFCMSCGWFNPMFNAVLRRWR